MHGKSIARVFLCVFILIVFPVVTSTVSSPIKALELNIRSTSYFIINTSFETCGDEIDTPAYPG